MHVDICVPMFVSLHESKRVYPCECACSNMNVCTVLQQVCEVGDPYISCVRRNRRGGKLLCVRVTYTVFSHSVCKRAILVFSARTV